MKMKKFGTPFLAAVLTAVMVALAVPARPAYAVVEWQYDLYPPASPPAGWVQVRWILTSSGCSGCTCGSNWQPGTQTGLMEKPGDRQTVGRNEGPTSSPWGSTADPRAQCPESGEWAAGTWYHNAVFPVEWTFGGCRWEGPVRVCDYYGSWGSKTWEGGNFAENDECCSDGGCGPGPGPTPCPSGSGRDPASMTDFAYRPNYPVVVGQDGDGFYITASFHQGRTWWEDCDGRHYQDDPITRVDVSVSLAESSVRWIREDLARRYPGADVKDTYPKTSTLYGGPGRANVSVRWPSGGYFEAVDPGHYVVIFRVRAQSGAVDTFTRQVPVHLRDSTIVE